ncbi:lasso peptide biosynthesis B2 protein [Sphingopyxis sp. LARHCG72]
MLRARTAIRSARLATTIAELSRRKAEAGCDPESITGAALRFEANRSSVPIARRCLIDSVALMCMLLARGVAADLIFGVRTGPFAAHCWLQAGGHVLTCAQDEARNFTPILVI